MKTTFKIVAVIMVVAMLAAVLAACGESGSKDAIAGTWKQTDDVNGNWTWTFDGAGKCNLDGETTGFKSDGTYTIDETAKTVTVKINGWDDEKVYTYTLTDTTLDLNSTYSNYHLVKQ